MTITSYGYPPVDPANPTNNDFILTPQWAQMVSLVGVDHAIVGANDFVVSVNAAKDRGVAIPAGTAIAGGVLATSNAADTTLQADTVASGSRYDAVAMRFNWTTKQTTFVIVKGGTVNGVPSGMANGASYVPGTQYDVPLWLIRVDAGSTKVTLVADLRIFKTYAYVVDNARAVDVLPKDHHSTVRTPNGEVTEFRTGVGFVGVSKPGHVWDPDYGFLPLVISESRTAPVSGTTSAAADGSVSVPLSKTYAAGEKYVWTACNDNFPVQNAMWVRGTARPGTGPISALTVSYAQGRGGNASFGIVGVLSSPSFTS